MAIDTTNGAAVGIVEDGYAKFSDLGVKTFKQALDLVQALPNIQIPTISINVDFPEPGPVPSSYILPPVPVPPTLTFNQPSAPTAPLITIPAVPSVPDIPVFSATPPDFVAPPKPDALAIQAPMFADNLPERTLPNAPVFSLPDAPTLRTYNLPDPPTTLLPEFTATLEHFNILAPNSTFNFAEAGYTSANLPVIQSRINEMLAGGTGLPLIIEQALFDRARAREDQTAQKAVQEAVEDWSARGFKLPGGELAARVRNVRQDNQDKANSLQRDITVQVHQVAIENLRFSVTQGIALEGILIGLYQNVQQRAFEVQKFTLESAINLFNANISLYNVKLQEFQARSQVFRDQIQAETLAIEVYKSKLEGQKLIGELNQQDVTIYTERIAALNSVADLYKTQISAVETQLNIDRLTVDVFKTKVDAYAQQVAAKRSEFEAWGEEIRGETAKINAYQAEAGAYQSLVSAYSTKIEAGLQQPRLQIEAQRLTLDKFNGDVSAYNALVNAEAQRVTSAVGIFRGQADIYSAQANAEQGRFGALARQFELAIEDGKAHAEIAIEQAKALITQVQTAAQLYIEALKGAAATGAQLAASAISSVNLAARIEESSSINTSTNYNLTGISPSPPAA